ncbi:hypothetical protein ACOMICROBIO_LMKGKHOH_04025 [Vibrio sp. B1FIG11]|uniref:DUF2589 domain-containing protein n=1 Tax=Vibrio TaxID=662 RepID=UPI00097FAEDD|nr:MULTISPECIES: DUF2589 domain-containing protein [Vibrio]AQM69931.1 hypothetical protein Vca1114GL_03505 [Vibrio campbellii]CAD7827219.1 hypothetical protein ACOMICROBIO_LMKGKHOH_04025 [Vibrio sp. B1FIG11]CAE6963166.1 hypothetical protein ACOMICROBIO_LMKGKHOH_04025 [Vibrio sp. B1FIG11]
MADSKLLNIADQFRGLPMEDLIGAPLTAACNAQEMLANTTINFIERVCFKDLNAGNIPKDGSLHTPNYEIRTVPFSFKQQEGKDQKSYKVEVPLMSIINIPSLQVTDVDINFSMEVKSSFSESSKEEMEAKAEVETELNAGMFKMKAKMSGSISSSKESSRKSDNSAKYDVNVVAKQLPPPEGLSRVLDMLDQCIMPVPAEAA